MVLLFCIYDDKVRIEYPGQRIAPHQGLDLPGLNGILIINH